jgi:hypothetical protein
MARAATGGRTLVGGQRRSCRRLLPTLLLLAAFLPAPASAAVDDAQAWLSARRIQQTQVDAIAAAAVALSDGGDEREVSLLRRRVAAAIVALDAIDVRECFRVWWSYVRTSLVLYDQAIIGLQVSDSTRVRTATAASTFLTGMAYATAVDCPVSIGSDPEAARLGPRGGVPLVGPVSHVG